MSDYPFWVMVLRDFGIPIGGALVAFGLAWFVLTTNREDRKNQIKEKQDRWTFEKCHRAIRAVINMNAARSFPNWENKIDADAYLNKIIAPMVADLLPDYRFHNKKMEIAWRTFYQNGESQIQKSKKWESLTEKEQQEFADLAHGFFEVAWSELNYVDANMPTS